MTSSGAVKTAQTLNRSQTSVDNRSMPSRSKRKSERGASLVEAALVAPLFLLILFFILEMGLVFRNSLTTDNASREGARAASAKGNSADTDFFVLRTVEHGVEAMGLMNLDYVVVFKATGPNDPVPGGCTTGSVPGVCNHYTVTDFFADLDDAAGNDTGNFRCGTRDSSWCPTTRETSLSAGTDFVGVHVATRHEYVTGIFGSDFALGETTILKIEPDES